MKRALKFIAPLMVAALMATACNSNGEEPRTYHAQFSRAVQVFPGVKVTVLGVEVGRVTRVENVEGAVEIDFRVTNDEVPIAEDVKATILPVSLLGERYIQLFPAYEGGATLEPGTTIPLERTTVPAEGDELLQAMQDYLGALDPETVERFVTNTAQALEGKGEKLNALIDRATEVFATLNARRDELADLIVQFNTVAKTLSTREDEIAQLLDTYNVVGSTVIDMRSALEGTIEGLNDAAAQLAGLLIDHRNPLAGDIEALTRTTRTLDRNIETLARTGHWAKRLFRAASKAVDYEQDWLRLSNQGRPLVELILARLQDRLVGVCLRLGVPQCATLDYWAEQLPALFCQDDSCSADRSRDDDLRGLSGEIDKALDKKKCKDAKHPKRCRQRKREQRERSSDLEELIDRLVGLGGLLGGRSS